MQTISPAIKHYIETKILPQYRSLKGHTSDHIETVIRRSLAFVEQAPEVNVDMVYVIAAYHDLGRLIDNETHNIESGKMLRADKFLNKHFSESEIETMAEAVEDHRASLGHEPRSIYGKIVSSADRATDIKEPLARAYDYGKSLHPDWSEEDIIERARLHLRKKYSPNGYAAKTMYFKNPEFDEFLKQIEELTRDKETFYKAQIAFNKSHKKSV